MATETLDTKTIKVYELQDGDELAESPSGLGLSRLQTDEGYRHVIDTIGEVGSGMRRMWVDVYRNGHEYTYYEYMWRDDYEDVEIVSREET